MSEQVTFQDLQRIRAVSEDSIALAAYSVDGRSFSYQAPVRADIPNGGYVIITGSNGARFLGQIHAKELGVYEGTQLALNLQTDQLKDVFGDSRAIATGEGVTTVRVRGIEGHGVVLATLQGDQIVRSLPPSFANAHLEPASEDTIRQYLTLVTEKSATLEIGRMQQVAAGVEVPAFLRARGLNRHTFLCGQSGSGKTFALGVILEQLLLHTDLRIVILDPNSDYVRLNDPYDTVERVNLTRSVPLSGDAFQQLLDRYRRIADQVHVFRPRATAPPADARLEIYCSDLTPDEQAVLLEMDPLRDMQQYNVFTQIIENISGSTYTLGDVHEAILASSLALQTRDLGLRIENMGIRQWEIWARAGERSLTDVMRQEDWRCLIVDTGTLSSPIEESVIAISVLGHLWRERNQRQPILIVIDEAHNICPHEPLNKVANLSTQACIRIAGEGRKFGLYLLLATQRPGKIQANVLSQCDNLILMRMNSSVDLKHIRDTLSFAPANLVSQAAYFELGETLIAGNIVPNPTFARFGGRLTHEGGADIPSAWAKPKRD